MPDPQKTVKDAPNGAPAPDTAATEATGGARPPAAPDDTVPVPPHIGRYEVRKLLGNGTFGRVFLAYDPKLKREVAIKQPSGVGLTKALLENFLKEAQAVACISHPNVCLVYDTGTDGGLPFIVMQYVPGGTLADLLRPGRPALALYHKLVLARQLAAGLAAAHAHGITHRDLKPGNILYDHVKGRVLIADFGLAQVLGPDVEASGGGVKGTPAYMAPEQWSPNKPHAVGPLSDVYALGIILYEMLTGRVPFVGTIMELMLDHCNTMPPPPSRRAAGVDPALDEIVLRAIAKNPANRYESAQELSEELAVYQGLSINDDPNGGTKESRPVTDADLARRAPKTGSRRVPRPVPPPLPPSGPPSDSPSKPFVLPESGPPQPPTSHLSHVTDLTEETELPEPPVPNGDSPRRKRWPIAVCLVLIGMLACVAVVLAFRKPPKEQPPDGIVSKNNGEDTGGKDKKGWVPIPDDPQKGNNKVEPGKPKDKDPVASLLLDPALRPSAARAKVGYLETAHVVVVSRSVGAGGERLLTSRKERNVVTSNEPVMALPGYKADVRLGDWDRPDVEVGLWGNVPDQLLYRVFESKVTFHQPPEGFDADLTLHAGRVYLKSKKLDAKMKPLGAKVRLRLAHTREVWDVTLIDEKSHVLAELVSWFGPDVPYARAGEAPPRREARVAVVAGSANFAAQKRPAKQFDNIGENVQILWDSFTDRLSDPVPIADQHKRDATRFPLTVGTFVPVTLTGVQTKMADAVAESVANGGAESEFKAVLAVLRGSLNPPEEVRDRDVIVQQAVYALAALAESPDDLKELLDLVKTGTPWPTRQAAVTALAQWVGRDVRNTIPLHAILVKHGLTAEEADEFLALVRAPVSPLQPDAAALDRALAALTSRQPLVRAAALWNLMVADRQTWVPPPLSDTRGIAEAEPDSKTYGSLVTAWKQRVGELKKGAKAP